MSNPTEHVGDVRDTTDGRSSPSTTARERLQSELSRALQADVIPRLVRSHQREIPFATVADIPATPLVPVPGASPAADADPPPHVAELCRRLLLRDERAADAYVDELIRDQLSAEAVLLDMLAPAARHLGALWSADLCDFTAVTVGVWRLERILRRIGDHPAVQQRPIRAARRILLMPAPGEQHTFGLSMLAQSFRQAGWDVRRLDVERENPVRHLVRQDWIDMVGISASCVGHLEPIQSCVHDIRRVSRNRSIRIIVGGPAFDDGNDQWIRVGADGYAKDARQAVGRATEMVSLVSRLT